MFPAKREYIKATLLLIFEEEEEVLVKCLVCSINMSHGGLRIDGDTPKWNNISRKCKRTHPDPEL